MTSSAVQPAVRDHHSRDHHSAPDIAGAVVLGGCAVWAMVSAMGRAARPEGVLLAVLAVAAGYACGKIAGSLLPVAAATAGALAGLGLACVDALSGPGGHEGVDAARWTLAAGAACCAAWAARTAALRLALWLLALAITVMASAMGSEAGWVAGGCVLLGSLLLARLRRRLLGLVGLALIVAVAVGGCWAVAEDALPGGVPAALRGHLTEQRVRLWQDAARLAETGPVRGAGPDRFGELSPTAQESAGPEAKPHSAPLQQAAEQGVPGMALLGAAFGWMLVALWRSPRSTPVVMTAAVALTALAVESSLGNALSFPQVTAGAGLLAGLATARLPEDDGGAFTDGPATVGPVRSTY